MGCPKKMFLYTIRVNFKNNTLNGPQLYDIYVQKVLQLLLIKKMQDNIIRKKECRTHIGIYS